MTEEAFLGPWRLADKIRPSRSSRGGKSVMGIRTKRWLLASYALGLAAIALQMAALHWTARGVNDMRTGNSSQGRWRG